MDKKSNRTDLLAAGRKKLEQYRQKNSKGKDGKGKHGKGSSSKSKSRADNSEQRDDDESVMPTSTNAPTEASQLPEIAHHLNPESDSSTSVPLNNTEDSTSNEPIDNAIPVPVLDDEGNDKAPSVGVADSSLDDSDDIKTSSSSKEMEKLSVDPIDDERSAFGIPMLEAANDDPFPSTTSSASGACADEDNRPPVPVEVDIMKKEDQEVHGSGSKDNDRNMMLGEQEVANLSVPLMENSTRAGESDTPCIVTDVEHDMEEDYGYVASISDAAGSDGQAVTLMKLVDVIKGLSEDDFMFLINSRSLVNSNKLPVQTEYSDVCAVLQEHLYVTNISKELSLLQLFEASKHEIDLDHKHKQLVNEISVLTASLDDANERNTCLYAELVECRSELKAAICEKEEFQSQYCSADAGVKELSFKVDELRVIIEESSTNLSKLSEKLDYCKSQLADSLAENERLVNTLSSIAEENNKDMVLKEQLLDEKLSRELAGCMSSVSALQVEVVSLNVSLAFETDERQKDEEETQFLSAKNEKLSVDLADCKCLMNSLEEENSKLNANLTEVREGRQIIEEMKENLTHENERLSNEVSEYQERSSEEHIRFMQLEDDLKQARLRHEQLMEENSCLRSTQEINKGKISESSNIHLDANVACADELQNIPTERVMVALPSVAPKAASDDSEERLPVSHLKGDIYDDHSGFVILKGRVEEAEGLLQDLDKAMDEMYSHSMSLSRSFGRSSAPGISKLIQAFESKPSSDDNESEINPPAGDDLYMSAKHQTGSLGLVLKAMHRDIVHAVNFSRVEEESRESASLSLVELLADAESWKDCCVNMELHNVELEVQYEVMKQHMYSLEVKQIELKTSYEALRGKENSLMRQNIQLAEKLTDYQFRTSELFDQLDEVRKSSREMASNVHSDLEELRKDVMEKTCKVEGALASSFSMAAQVVEKLDAAIGSPVMPPNTVDNFGSDEQILVSVTAACHMIEDLKERLDAASRENKTLSVSYEEMSTKSDALYREYRSSVDILQNIFAELMSCLDTSLGHVESENHPEESTLYDASRFEAIIKQLSSLLNERQQLKELNDNLHSELLNRNNDEEALKKQSFDLDLLRKLVEDVRDVLKLQPADMSSDEHPLLLLHSLFSLLVGKYKDADDNVILLTDDLKSRMTELRELQDSLETLNSFSFQQQNEILVLKESLKQAKDVFDVTREELLVKATELEHCEQRFASIREKLSIAVAKGKGLIVQRDSLKQSLSETSTELERCSQELQLKEARLHEVEHKLKVYSEAGERVESLESELSYIRNSATALRESFLLKDSALQRIEEILEDLELPEHFHSRDIVEKINYLATTVAANSLLAADWEQRSSVGVGSFSDAGNVKTDSWKDDSQPSLNPVDDLRRQYDELQNRFFALAEQNEMLEQSLIERNNLVQRWEGVLDRIDTPVQIRAMEPDERIQWLGTALSEADHHMISLQQKVENLENDCGSVAADLEESQRRASDLEFSLQTVTHERNDLEQSLIERNNLLQRWEEVLDRIDTPLPVRSMKPEERIQWIGTALSQADYQVKSLQQKVDSLETYCGSINTNLEESRTQISELQISLQGINHEKETLSAELSDLKAITANLEESRIQISDLQFSLQGAIHEKETLSAELSGLRSEHDKVVANLEDSRTQISELQFSLQGVMNEKETISAELSGLRSEYDKVIANLEDSRTQISELQFSLQGVNYEKETLSAGLSGLRSEHDKVIAKFEDSRTQISELQFSLQGVIHEKETLSAELSGLRSEHEKSLEKVAQFKQVADDLRSEVDALQGKLTEKLETEKHILQTEDQMLRWRDLIVETLQSCGTESLIPDGSSPGECLEVLLQGLVDEFMRFRSAVYESRETTDHSIPDDATDLPELRARDALNEDVQSATDLKRELDDAMGQLAYLKEERDEYMKRSQSLVYELEELEKKKEEVQKQLNQEEQKSASLREKLNVAVKKGKSLVQHRDALKQNIEGLTAEIESLKSELKMRDDSIAVFDQNIKDLSSQIKDGHVLEGENTSLRNQLSETIQHLQEREHTLSMFHAKLDQISIASEREISNPVQKFEEILIIFSNLHGTVVSSEQETKKAKRAAELLLAELNEVQERNDNLQEDLAKAHEEISELSRQKDVAESAKLQVISRLQELSEETRNQRAEYDLLKSHVHNLERGLFDVGSVIADVFAKDMGLLNRLRTNLESCVEAIGSDLQLPRMSGVLMSWIADQEGYLSAYSLRGFGVQDQTDDIGTHLSQLTRDTEKFKERVSSDSQSLHAEAELLLEFIGDLHSEAISLKRSLNLIKGEYLHLESAGKKKDMECTAMHQCITSLYEVCFSSIMEIESRRAQVIGNGFPDEDINSTLKALPLGDGGLNFSEQNLLTTTENVKRLGDRLLLAVRGFVTMHAKGMESDQKEMRATILNLQKELQEKDIQKERMCAELVSQIKEAEATSKGYSSDLQSAKVQVHDLETRLQLTEEERKLLENRIADMQQKQGASMELQDKVVSLTNVITAKEQEIEALMHALDEEENQMEGLKSRVDELEMDLKRKSQDLEQAVAARAKALKKLSITVSKFDELHHMSEGLLSEIENLQTQLQEREAEISFLRQEVTRCTNDTLLASKTAKEINAKELQDLLRWLETTFSRVIVPDMHSVDNNNNHQNIEQKDRLQMSLASIIDELEELRITAQRKDSLLQAERNRVEELLRRKEALEASLREKESDLTSLVSAGESGHSASEIVEVESVINKWVAPVPSTASQVRSLRKSTTEQVAIAIDSDAIDSQRLEDEDDDKVHGFKSLTTSRFVPKFTRPVSDMIDGLWVSCDRALMRQPGLRLGIMIYWALLHALLATYVV